MKTRQKSILKHIQTVVTLGIILLVVFLEMASVISIKNALLNDTKREIIYKANAESEYIDSWLAKKVGETENIAETFTTMEAFTDDEAQAYLTKAAGLDSDVLNYYLCRSGIEYVVYNGGIFGLDPTGRSWWSAAWAAGKTIITDAYVDANSGAIVVSVATPFYLDGVESIILADITMDTLVTSVQGASDENMSLFLAGSDETIIVHNNADFCMQADGSSTKISDIYKLNLSSNDVQNFEDENGNKNYIVVSTVESNNWIIGAYLPNSYITGRTAKALIFGLVVAAVVGILGIVCLGVILKKQLAPMNEMKGFVKDVVVGEANVSSYKYEKDEIAFLIKELKEKFVETIRKTKSEMINIDGNIQTTNSSVGDIVDAVNGISSVIERSAASMDSQTDSISSISNDCTVISNASVEVASQAQEMAEKSSQIENRISKLIEQTKADKEISVQSCAESQKKVEAAIKEAECINEITNISDAIKAIAAQTNLLSLNASIESARAGEAGRGFAVVAEEIRGLSDETNREIDKISALADRLLNAVTTLSDESVDSMNNLSRDIQHAYETVDLLAGEYGESARYFSQVSADLGASSEELSASVQTVADSIESISANQQEVNSAMDSANKEIQVVAEDATSVKTKVESVSIAVEEVSQTVQQFNV